MNIKRRPTCYRCPLLRHKRQSAGGFTLLELLVAIMILTLMMTVAFGAVRLGGRSWEAGVERADESEEVRAVSDFLRRQFAQMIPITVGDDKLAQNAFAGGRNSIRFIAPAPQRRNIAGLVVYKLVTEEYSAGQRLVLSYTRFDPGADDFRAVEPDKHLVLADGFAGISFEFFGTQMSESVPSWHREWPHDEETLPELVRITLTSADDAKRWPTLILKILVEEQSS